MMRFAAMFLLLLPVWAAGCGSTQWLDPVANPAAVEATRNLVYPDQSARGEPLDISLVQRGNRLQIINRTAQNFEGMQLWLNREFVGLPGTIAVGSNDPVPMNRFINRLGEPFPTPGLLTPEKGRRLVLAELFDPQTGLRHALWVQVEGRS